MNIQSSATFMHNLHRSSFIAPEGNLSYENSPSRAHLSPRRRQFVVLLGFRIRLKCGLSAPRVVRSRHRRNPTTLPHFAAPFSCFVVTGTVMRDSNPKSNFKLDTPARGRPCLTSLNSDDKYSVKSSFFASFVNFDSVLRGGMHVFEQGGFDSCVFGGVAEPDPGTGSRQHRTYSR